MTHDSNATSAIQHAARAIDRLGNAIHWLATGNAANAKWHLDQAAIDCDDARARLTPKPGTRPTRRLKTTPEPTPQCGKVE